MEDKNFLKDLISNKSASEELEVELAKSGAAVFKKEAGLLNEDGLDESSGQLTVDVYQTGDEIIVESPIAGVNPDDIDVAITTDSVTIKGKRERERHIKEEDYVYQECYWGRFSRSVVLPQEVDAEKAEANIKNGVLIIHLPKLNRLKSKKLKVKSE